MLSDGEYFDWTNAELVIAPRNMVCAQWDEHGCLLICEDRRANLQHDQIIRIARDDVPDVIASLQWLLDNADELNAKAATPVIETGRRRPLSNAERQRRYRKNRNGRNGARVTRFQNIRTIGNDPPPSGVAAHIASAPIAPIAGNMTGMEPAEGHRQKLSPASVGSAPGLDRSGLRIACDPQVNVVSLERHDAKTPPLCEQERVRPTT